VVLLLLIAAVYLLPLLIAMMRRHNSALAIAALNVALGWTIAGWFIAFLWSLTGDTAWRDERLAGVTPRRRRITAWDIITLIACIAFAVWGCHIATN
jgi:hypothetical protein